MADPHHNPALVIVDCSELGVKTIELPGDPAVDKLCSRYTGSLVYIVYDVEDLGFVIQIHHGTSRKHFAHAFHEDIPLLRPVKIVSHEEAAAQEIIAHLAGFLVVQAPVP